MAYRVLFGSKAARQFKKLTPALQQKVRDLLTDVAAEPYLKSFILSADLARLRYIKFSYQGVPYRIVFTVSEERQEIGVLFLGTRQNFYRDLKRYVRSL
uniref:Plasmid stabilization system protein n=2 Tax=Candidatus Bipolaricaulota TaxID=67810 RepID=H5SJK1_9BACT|nr:plasmid stabilization system protein [uncultured Acetothermia bacterium]BAL60122.1 plasmid stabilization system protein [Candidatus Acetothermum autotrophicum]